MLVVNTYYFQAEGRCDLAIDAENFPAALKAVKEFGKDYPWTVVTLNGTVAVLWRRKI